MTAGPLDRVARRKAQLDALAQLLAAWSLAVAIPFLRVTAPEQPFFLAHGIRGADLVFFATVLVALPPILLWLLYRISALVLGRRASRVLLRLLVGSLTALIVLPLLNGGLFESLAAVALVAGSVALAIAVLLAKSVAARRVLQLSAVAAPLAILQFVAFSPARQLLSGPPAQAASGEQHTAARSQRSLTHGKSPVVLIVFDELPSYALEGRGGRIDSSRFPTFAYLASTSTWFRFATSPASDTYLAVPSIVTGARPRADRAPVAAAYPANLFSLLAPYYQLVAYEPVTGMCQVDECRRYSPVGKSWWRLIADSAVVAAQVVSPPPMRERLPRIDQSYADFLGDDGGGSEGAQGASDADASDQLNAVLAKDRGTLRNAAAATERVLRQLPRKTEEPPFIFLHVELPHIPWHYFPDLVAYESKPLGLVGIIGDRWLSDRRLIEQQKQKFLFQVGATDLMLAHIVQRLKTLGIWDRALVIVTSDHGVAFYPGYGRREPFARTFAALAGVPLFVKAPFQRSGRVSGAPASTIDIAPTVLAAAGLRERSLPGTNLLAHTPSRRRLTITSQRGKRVHVSWAQFKRDRLRLAKAWSELSDGGWEAVSTRIAPNVLRRAAAEKGASAPRADVTILSFSWRRVRGISGSRGERERAVDRGGTARVAVVANVALGGDAGARGRWVGLRVGGRLIAVAPVYEFLGGKYASLVAYGVRARLAALRRPEFVVR